MVVATKNSVIVPARMADLSPPDRLRVMRRSLRCAGFGELGVMPLLGLPAAICVLWIHRQICRQTGEKWRYLPLNLILTLCLVDSVAMWVVGEWPEAIVILLFAFSYQFCVVYLYLRNATARFWNPARRELFIGLANANIGLFLSLWAVAMLILAAKGVFD